MARKIKARISVLVGGEQVDHTEILDETQAANTSGALLASLAATGVTLPNDILAAISSASSTPTNLPKEIQISLFFRPYQEG